MLTNGPHPTIIEVTRVDFYLLDVPSPGGKLRLACRLAEKAYRLGHKVYVHTMDLDQSTHIDDLLWTFHDGSFIPHVQLSASSDEDNRYAVVIGSEEPPAWLDGILISLRPGASECFTRFQRVAEPVDYNDQDKRNARQRFRYYRDHGATLNTHHVTS